MGQQAIYLILLNDLSFEAEPYFYDKTTNQAASESEEPLNLLNQMIRADGTHISRINLVCRAKRKEEFKVRSVGKKITNFALLDRERDAICRAKILIMKGGIGPHSLVPSRD